MLYIKAAVNTIVPRSPFFAFCTSKYRLLQTYNKCGRMSASMKWRYLSHSQLLSKAKHYLTAMARKEICQRDDIADHEVRLCSLLTNMALLKISCLLAHCVVCNRRWWDLLHIKRLPRVRHSHSEQYVREISDRLSDKGWVVFRDFGSNGHWLRLFTVKV